MVAITSIKFNQFKALHTFSVRLDSCNILVGPNNAGKSTVISAFRLLEAALRTAGNRRPEFVTIDGRNILGHRIPVNGLPVSLENVHTDYIHTDTNIAFRFSNSNFIYLTFPHDGGCIMTWDTQGPAIRTAQGFRNAFPYKVQVVPVLGPLEHEEPMVTDETVKRSVGTPRACRHFRNFWYKNPEGFENFREMLERTWPGMSIGKPEFDSSSSLFAMYCKEGRMDREVFWAGFGFQIWCQLLTHLSRSKEYNLTVIDEPEVYLHPDLQRQLLTLLRSCANDFVLATHSTEIMGEADPSEILIIDKTKKSARRVKDVEGVQEAMNALGSIQNITLTQLARNKKVLFCEGAFDYKVIRRFAAIMGFSELASGNDITQLASEGYSSWTKVQALAWGLKSALGTEIKIAAIYDRDFWCDAETESVEASLKTELAFAHIHRRKEMENYLLVPSVLQRCLNRYIVEKNKRDGGDLATVSIEPLLEEITSGKKFELQGQYLSKYTEYHRNKGKDPSTLNSESLRTFEDKWSNLRSRMEIVCGKDVLRELRAKISDLYSVTLTDLRIIDEFDVDEIPTDLQELIASLDKYRLGSL
ncbi:ATP-dependent nuclease [Pseudomonas sp.]|uniref:ATP-dependent nuclease n=1 Tax=Pseudomonas sp. TaxID=306 RepID=UPI0028A5FC07|nr:AAA family ATPase [Pseudomonas sp.]